LESVVAKEKNGVKDLVVKKKKVHMKETGVVVPVKDFAINMMTWKEKTNFVEDGTKLKSMKKKKMFRNMKEMISLQSAKSKMFK
jgi:hypothetical protein